MKQENEVSMAETFCGFNNNSGVLFKNNNTIAMYIDSYVDGLMHYNFISQRNDNNDDDTVSKMIRQILQQDERIKGNSIFF